MNPDDIRARAEGVGYRINHCLEGYEIWVPDDRFHPPERLLIIFRDYDKSFQAALDLIEAEERRQCTNATGYPCCKDVDTDTLACHKCMIYKVRGENHD